MRTLCYILFAAMIASAANGEQIRFSAEWGLYMDNAGGHGPEGTVVSAKNVDFFGDGTWRVRYPIATDTIFAGGDVSFLATLRNARTVSPRNWTLVAVDDNTWWRRNNQTGEYDLLNPSGHVRSPTPNPFLTSVAFENQLIIGGELSEISHFTGDSLTRLMMPVRLDTLCSVDTLSGKGSLDTSAVYKYRIVYKDRSGWMSYASVAAICTTSATARACSLFNLPTWPDQWAGSADTADVAVKLLFRDDGTFDNYYAAIPRSQTSFVDSGQYTVDVTLFTPPVRPVLHTGKHLALHRNKLWLTPGDAKHITPFRLDTTMGVDNDGGPLSYERFPVRPAIPKAHTTVARHIVSKASMEYGRLEQPGDGTVIYVDRDAGFVRNGVVPGDYLMMYASAPDRPYAEVLAVLDDSTIVVESSPGGPYSQGSVGNNLFQIDDEIIGIAGIEESGDDTGWWEIAQNYASDVLARGLFGTTRASHDSLTPIYRVNPRLLGNSNQTTVYRSEVYEAARIQTQDPRSVNVESITGMFPGVGYVGVTSPSATYQLREGNYLAVSPLASNIGNVAPRGVVPYLGGAFLLDRRGVYFVADGEGQMISDPLGDALSDSSAFDQYRRAAGAWFDGKLYYSIPHTADLYQQMWIADFSRRTPWERPVWTRYHAETDSASPIHFTVAGDANFDDHLFFGSYGTGAVHYFSDTFGPDTVADVSKQIHTSVTFPRFSIPGSTIQLEQAVFTFDTRDSVRVRVKHMSPVGYGRSPQSYDTTVLTLSPADGDTSVPDTPRQWRTQIGTSGIACESAQFIIETWSDDADPFVGYPFVVRYSETPWWGE